MEEFILMNLKRIDSLSVEIRLGLGLIVYTFVTILIFFIYSLGTVYKPFTWILTFLFLLSTFIIKEKKYGALFGVLIGITRVITLQQQASLAAIINDPISLNSFIYLLIFALIITFTGLIGYCCSYLHESISTEYELNVEIREQRNRFEAILQAFPQPVILINKDSFEVMYNNKAFEELIGTNPIGLKCYNVFNEKTGSCEFCPIGKFNYKLNDVFSWEMTDSKLGKEYLIFERMIKWHDIEEVIFKVFLDITERKEIEKEKLNLVESRKRFVDITTHELRTPLAIFNGNFEFLVSNWDKLEDEEVTNIFTALEKSQNRLERLINNINLLTEIQEDRLSPKIRTVNIEDVITRVVSMYDYIVNLVISIENKAETPLELKGDINLLENAFMNVLDNSIKNTPTNKEIDIKIEMKDPDVIISISDNGIGISEEKIDKIFDAFISFNTKYSIGRTGIGLFISREVVRAHKGELYIKSEGEGKGAMVSIKLPIH